MTTKSNIVSIYEGKRPLECEVCHLGFAENSSLKDHMFSDLDKHMSFVHEGREVANNVTMKPMEEGSKSSYSMSNESVNGNMGGGNVIIKPEFERTSKPEEFSLTSLTVKTESHTESIYEGKRPLECEICYLDFVDKVSLKDHIFSVHGEIIRFQCGKCTESFNQKCKLKRHMESVHERRNTLAHEERLDPNEIFHPMEEGSNDINKGNIGANVIMNPDIDNQFNSEDFSPSDSIWITGPTANIDSLPNMIFETLREQSTSPSNSAACNVDDEMDINPEIDECIQPDNSIQTFENHVRLGQFNLNPLTSTHQLNQNDRHIFETVQGKSTIYDVITDQSSEGKNPAGNIGKNTVYLQYTYVQFQPKFYKLTLLKSFQKKMWTSLWMKKLQPWA